MFRDYLLSMPQAVKRPPQKQADEKPSIISTADLARHLNLSQWAVSRAINGHRDISEKTRQKVLDAMVEMGFRPNLFARGLRGCRSGLIGICFSLLNIPILDLKLARLQKFLRERSLGALMESTSYDPVVERRVVEDFHRIQVDGAVLLYSNLSAANSKALLRSMACVHVDPNKPQQLPTVSLDRNMAMRLLLGHLLELGHRRIALLGIHPENPSKWGPLVKLATEWNLDPDKLFYRAPFHDRPESMVAEGAHAAARVLKEEKKATAYICLDDLAAIGAIQSIRSAGLSVPGDISVTGFNHQDVSRVLLPTITTIDQNIDAIMDKAGEILMEEIALPIAKRGKARLEKISPTLVVGQSTGRAR